ncbi:Eukaryotic translation initiation factor 4E type [Reticulomyxa filosa]|uniref:Eukaryotic translation initiation factor 4E type n=1 Tax=Reticulomyxa filosa TaxID=46433 RepID=X6PC85_RETFI|nr:Eukaryotic translation initiation factor 4E type [Reticulomyxa filosa]|eukprot:ETO35786.1 Eukaryotic translation initiation factor 4E type [Reticulomyxa filosa]
MLKKRKTKVSKKPVLGAKKKKQIKNIKALKMSSEAAPDTKKKSEINGKHPLQTAWTVHWWSKHTDHKTEGSEDWKKNIHQLGTFNSVESFWKHYVHLQRPQSMPHGFNVAVFRANLEPAWESFPKGGCWIIRVSKNERFLNRLWEELLMAVIGENFLTPELVGIVIAIRRDVANITVWNGNNNVQNDVRFRIGERLKEILNLDEESTVEYKFFDQAMADGSTHKNATPYTYSTV